MKNTLTGFTRILGRNFNDPLVQAEIVNSPYKVIEAPNGRAAFELDYLKERIVLSSEQATAIMLTKLKEIAESNLGQAVKDCVINVPVYFTDAERRAMLDAAHIAGLNCLKLMNDTTAMALSYGIYKKDLPEAEAPPRVVVFVNLGASNLQVSAVSFNAGKMKVLGTSFDHSVGGRDFDRAIYNAMAEDFKTRYKVDVNTNRKAELRLMAESEKLKKLMSANTTKIPLNIECFMEDKDVTGHMNRDTFEALVADLLKRIENALRNVLTAAQVDATTVHAVELVGASSRLPAVKNLVRSVYGQEPRSTLNADEAVARGCALQCAILSPAFRVRDFAITDTQPYSVTLHWQEAARADSAEIFPRQHAVPFSRMLTFLRAEPFELRACYTTPDEVPCAVAQLGQFKITGVHAGADNEPSKIKVKARINQHGIFTVCQAQLAEKYEVLVTEEPMDTKEPAPAPNATEAAPAADDVVEKPMEVAPAPEAVPPTDCATDGAIDGAAAAPAEPRKKTKVRYHDLPIEAQVAQLDKATLLDYTEMEGKMIAQDKQERERSSAKNAVEEYVYEMREKLAGPLEEFGSEADREAFSALLSATEDWLYDEGEDQVKQVYLDRLAAMHVHGDPMVRRHQEAEQRPDAVDAFGRAAQSFQKLVEAFRAGDAKYEHLAAEDVEKVARLVDEKRQWLITQSNAQAALPKCADSVLTAAMVKVEMDAMFVAANPVFTKPKPEPVKEAPPKDVEAAAAATAGQENSMDTSSTTAGAEASSEASADGPASNVDKPAPEQGTGAAPVVNGSRKPTDSKEDMDLD